MTLQRQAAHPRRAYARPLLVLALLAGLVAMHGLASAPVPAAAAETVRAAEHHCAAPLRSAPAEAGVPSGHRPEEGRSSGCRTRGHLHGHGHGSHPEHADAACAARGTAGGPLLLPPSVRPAGRPAPVGCTDRPPLPAGAPRVPPSPAELQLLRI